MNVIELKRWLDQEDEAMLKRYLESHPDEIVITITNDGGREFAKSAVDIEKIAEAVAGRIEFDVDAMAAQVKERLVESGDLVEFDPQAVVKHMISAIDEV